MSSRNIIPNYIPAQVTNKKECIIWFYAIHPASGQLKRVRHRCNRIKNKTLQLKYASQLCKKINSMLEDGWNPFISQEQEKSYALLRTAVQHFYKDKEQILREDSLRSYRSYTSYLLKWLKNKENDLLCVNFTKQHAFQLLEAPTSSGRKVSNTTYNNYLKFFRCLFNWLIEREYCTINHFEKITTRKKEVKKRTIVSDEFKNKIQTYLEYYDPHYWAVCTLCYACLIRPKEIMKLRVENFDFEKKRIVVPAPVAKNSKERLVAMPSLAFNALKKINLDKVDKKLLAFSKNYYPGKIECTSRDVGRTWQKLREKLDLPLNISFYSLKDTGITELLDAGIPSKIVQAHADHSTIAMTEKYNHGNFNLYESTIKSFKSGFTDQNDDK